MWGGRTGRLAAVLAAALVVGTAALGVAAPASAHSGTLRSDPPNGGMVPEGRTSLTLWFDEPIGAAASSFQVRTVAGLAVDSSAEVRTDPARVIITTPPLERGQYRIDWHALSLADGHASSGTIVFGAGLRPDAVAAQGAGAPPADLLMMRWLDLSVLLLALGSLAVGGRVLGAAGDDTRRARDQVRCVGALAACVAVYSGAVTPLLRTRSSGAAPPAWLEQTWLTLSQTGWGRLWLVRELALLVAAGALVRWWRHRGRGAGTRRLAATALVVAVLTQARGGHAASLPSGSSVDALMDAGHLLGSGVWVGGLTLLAITLVPLLRRAGAWPGARLPVWRAFAPRAAVASVVLLATGLYQAGHHVPDLEGLASTVYGRTVGVKVLLVVSALALAAVNTVLVGSRLGDHGPAARLPVHTVVGLRAGGPRLLTRTVTTEVAVLGVAVLAAALLTTVPTAREVAVATRPTSPSAATVDGLFMTFEAVPETAGRYRLILRMRSTIQPEPAPVTAIDVRVDGSGGRSAVVPLLLVEEGRFEGSTAALDPGPWRGTVRVHRAGLVDSEMDAAWVVADPGDLTTGALGTVSTGASALMLAGLVGSLMLIRRRRTPLEAPESRHPELERSAP